MSPADVFNVVEAGLWSALGIGFAIRGALRRDQRRVFLGMAATLLAFGASDLVELQTGAWWEPWWLLVWKCGCGAALAFGFRALLRRKS